MESSKVLQQQLEIQLESTKKQLHLMQKEVANVKSQAHTLHEENLQLRREILSHESHKDKLLVSFGNFCSHLLTSI